MFRRFALFLALIAAGGTIAAQEPYPFRLFTQGGGPEFELMAANAGAVPVSVLVPEPDGGLAADRPWPLAGVVAPHSTRLLARITQAAASGAPLRSNVSYSFRFGRFDAVHDARAAYRLPFGRGEGYLVSQASGGRLVTHDAPDTQFAVDFSMPAGTPVLAARAGVVVDVVLAYTAGGPDERLRSFANGISVAHEDGTVAEYVHLMSAPAVVAPGRRVAAGALLGYSGNTGYSTGPHLHFMVSRPVLRNGTFAQQSIPVLFASTSPPGRFAARSGMIVFGEDGPAAMAQPQQPDSQLSAPPVP